MWTDPPILRALALGLTLLQGGLAFGEDAAPAPAAEEAAPAPAAEDASPSEDAAPAPAAEDASLSPAPAAEDASPPEGVTPTPAQAAPPLYPPASRVPGAIRAPIPPPGVAPGPAPAPSAAPAPRPGSGASAPSPTPIPAIPQTAPGLDPAFEKDAAEDLEVSLTSYYQKYLGRIRPDGDAYRENFPFWSLFFGVLPIPVFPAEGAAVLEAIQSHIETGRFQTLVINKGATETVAGVARHIEAVALKRAEIEAAQEGRYNQDLKGLDIYRHQLSAIEGAGFAYHLRLDEIAVLADGDLGRFVANAEATVTLYKVHLGSPPRGEVIGTLRVGGAGVSLNVLQFLNSSGRAGGAGLMDLLPPGLGGSAILAPIGVGATLAGGVIGREVALQRAVRNLLADLDVKLSGIEGFRLEAPVEGLDGRRIAVNLGTFEGLELDQSFTLWSVAPLGPEGCPDSFPESPAPGACGKRLGYARVRDIGDNTANGGGRRTPQRDSVDVLTGASEGASLEPYFSRMQLLIKEEPIPPTTLGLKVYEDRQAGRGVAVAGGVGITPGPAIEATYRRSISDLIPISELSLETAFALKPASTYAATVMLGPTKRVYVGRLGVYLGARVGLGARLDGCSDCRVVGVEGTGGLEVLVTPRFGVTAGATTWRLQSLGDDLPLIAGTSAVAGVLFLW